jgi:outer membrane lipoprotein SlyB
MENLKTFGYYMFQSVVFVAKTGIDYRKMKKGEISKDQFKRDTKIGFVAVGGGVAGATGGAAAGFAIGTAMFPGVGSAIGGFIGSIVGGVAGNVVSTKIYEEVEDKLNREKLKSQMCSEIIDVE